MTAGRERRKQYVSLEYFTWGVLLIYYYDVHLGWSQSILMGVMQMDNMVEELSSL